MEELIGNVKLNYDYYEGKDLYSDGDIEDQILQIVQENEEEYIDKIIETKDWAIYYHLSQDRENILEWLPISKKEKVLEIGSGCGAITGVLAKKAQSVTCIELSKKRSLINAYRHKKMDNIGIIVGNFEKVEENLKEKYDVSTLIGVFEYSESYISSQKPFEDFLNKLKKHLNKNGRIVIAIENQLGLKYWAGCMEDHVGKYFEGLEGYTTTQRVKTFGLNGYLDLFSKCGYQNVQTYYPYPDYKFAYKIFSDEKLPNIGELNDVERNFDQPRLSLFDETKVGTQIVKNNVFQHFSNSYLFVLYNDDSELFSDITFVKYNERKKEFDTITQVVKSGDSSKVIKRARTQEAISHLYHIKDIYNGFKSIGDGIEYNQCHMVGNSLELEYIPNMKSAEDILDEYLECKKYNLIKKKITEIIQNIVNKYEIIPFRMTDQFRDVFGECDMNTEAFVAPNIDLIFSNIVMNNGQWIILDYEWSFTFPIPVKYVIYRMLLNYVYTPRRKELVASCSFLDFGITDEECAVFEKMENNFQEYVGGKRYRLSKCYPEMQKERFVLARMMEGELRQKELDNACKYIQLYWDYGNGFCEQTSELILPNRNADGSCEVEIVLKKGCKAIRIDVASTYCILRQVLLKEKGEEVKYTHNGIQNEEQLFFFTKDPWLFVSRDAISGDKIIFQYKIDYGDQCIEDLMKEFQQREESWNNRMLEVEVQRKETEAKMKELEAKELQLDYYNSLLKKRAGVYIGVDKQELIRNIKKIFIKNKGE